MGAENAAELVELGGKIATLCGQLAELRVKRDELNTQVTALEKELTPLLVRHGELIAKMAGAALPPPPVPPTPVGAAISSSLPGGEKTLVERRVINFLKNAEPGTGALDIARALNIEASKVREVLRELATRAQSRPMAVEPDESVRQ